MTYDNFSRAIRLTLMRMYSCVSRQRMERLAGELQRLEREYPAHAARFWNDVDQAQAQ